MRSPGHKVVKEHCRKSLPALMEKHGLGQIDKVTLDESGWVNPCFFVNDSWVFRFNARDPNLPKYQREKMAFDLLRDSSIPVPQKVILDDSKLESPYDVLISELVRGRNLETDWQSLEPKQKELLAFRAGEILSEFDKVELSFFGELSGKGPLPQTSSWIDYLETKLDFHLDEAQGIEVIDSQIANEFRQALRNHKSIFVGIKTPKLTHVDFHFGNLLYEGNDICGVIDFEWSLAGDPYYDLCRWVQTEEEWPGSCIYFLKGFGKESFAESERDRLAVYQMLRNIELCVVAKTHFPESEAKSYVEITLDQMRKIR